MQSMYDECMETPQGRQGLAAANATANIMKLLEDTKEYKGLANIDIALIMGTTEQRIEEIFNGDGNLHIATVAKLLDAMDTILGLYTIDKEVIETNSWLGGGHGAR